jgi:hypothetical protein
MTVTATSQRAKSAFQKELEVFSQQLKRLGNCLLNKTFDLTVKGTQRRNRILIIIFLVLGFLFTFSAHSLGTWGAEIGNLFRYMFNAAYAGDNPDTLNHFFNFAFGAVLAPQTLRYLPVFVLPFIIALQAAARYLDDIFELNDVRIARDFILQVALTGTRKKLRISQGEVVEKDRNSPIFRIGGPGKVLVELDSVALFEKPDGTPHIIDSTKESNHVLSGFERLRYTIDLRDQFLELSEKENNSVTSRSLDGMKIKATDVRMVYRIRRDGQKPTFKRPHPYVKDTILHLVYNETRSVASEGEKPTGRGFQRTPTGLQRGAIESLIRGELGRFMSQYKLNRYLASYGMPEYEQALKREEEIDSISRSVADPDDPAKPQDVSEPPEFESRPKITDLFTEFTSTFPRNDRGKEVELDWIGVGTWVTPHEIVPEQHLEAWRLSLENLTKGSPKAMEALGLDKKIQEKIQLIQSVPLAHFQDDRDSGKDHKYIVQSLLVAYREQLKQIKELLEESQLTVPDEILDAIKYLERILEIKHGPWVGGGDISPPPGS